MPTHPNSRLSWYASNVTSLAILLAILALLAVQLIVSSPAVIWGDVSIANLQYAAIAPAFILAGFATMFWVARRSVVAASSRSAIRPASPQKIAGLSPMPETLRIITAPGLQYSIEMISGVALDKTATIHARAHAPAKRSSGSLGGDAVQPSALNERGNVWIRMPDRREAAWALPRGACDVRAGQIISAIMQRTISGQIEFLLIHNHATGELTRFDAAVAKLHVTRAGLAWPMAAVVGSIGFGVAFGLVRFADPGDSIHGGFGAQALAWLHAWKTAAILAGAVAVFVAYHSKRWLQRRRNAVFEHQYTPEFHAYLDGCTPALEKHFADLR
jgi:hypothetical protein